MAKLQIARLQVANTAARALRVTRLASSISTGPPPSAGADVPTVEPGSAVTLVGTPTAGTWTQTAGPTVSFAGSGATVSYVAPIALAAQTLTFVYTVGTLSASTNHTVLPVTERIVVGGVEVPVLWRRN